MSNVDHISQMITLTVIAKSKSYTQLFYSYLSQQVNLKLKYFIVNWSLVKMSNVDHISQIINDNIKQIPLHTIADIK